VTVPAPDVSHKHTSPLSKVHNNLAPLQVTHKGVSDDLPTDTALSIDIPCKPSKSLPKLQTPEKTADDRAHHAQRLPKPEISAPLAPLTTSKEKLVPAIEDPLGLHSSAVASALPNKSLQAQKVPPLDQECVATVMSNLSPDKNEKENIIEKLCPVVDNAHKKSKVGPALEPLQPQVPIYNPEEHNGSVTLLYEMYHEKFDITRGTITEDAINDVYGLSDVMPNCRLRLSVMTPAEVREATIRHTNAEGSADDDEALGSSCGSPCGVKYLPEHPAGIFCSLQNEHSYYVYVSQDSEELRREQLERDKVNMQKLAERAADNKIERDDGRGFDGCTCIYGTPCVDEYGCRDWSKRFDIAKANGWGGFPSSSAD